MDDNQERLFESPDETGTGPTLRWYTLKDGKHISSRSLREAERDCQLDAMRHWFHQNYEDPVESCPHDSREGGYPTMRELNRDLALWAKRKYKKLRSHLRKAKHWIARISRRAPALFAHWQMGGGVAP